MRIFPSVCIYYFTESFYLIYQLSKKCEIHAKVMYIFMSKIIVFVYNYDITFLEVLL